MIGKSAAIIFDALLDKKNNSGKTDFTSIIHQVASYPIKAIAAFISAPVLIVRIALTVKNPVRRIFAVTGIVVSLVLAYLAATFLGSFVGSLFILDHFGPLAAFGFLVGTTISVVLSVAFSYIIFTATAFTFLHLSSQEVADYLTDLGGASTEDSKSQNKTLETEEYITLEPEQYRTLVPEQNLPLAPEYVPRWWHGTHVFIISMLFAFVIGALSSLVVAFTWGVLLQYNIVKAEPANIEAKHVN